MIDHLSLNVRDLNAARAFYSRALEPLGYKAMAVFPGAVGMGATEPDFWLAAGAPSSPIHLAFRAETRAQVDAFYRAAVEAGGRDNGAPGPRPQYHENYYGAFVIDPDGHNIEAVCHKRDGQV